VLLLWLVFSSMTPFRNIRYEIFVIQHIISFIGFLVAVFYHIPAPYALNARIFIWLGIGFFLLDRLIRYTRSAIHNRRLGKATLTSLPGNVTRISVHAPMVKKWTPGQHVLLCLPRLGLGQSHPATIASIPSSHDNDLVFFLRAHRGFTNRVLTKAASASTESLLEKRDATTQSTTNETLNAFIDGPYGGSQSDFAAFDTAVLIAGSTGVTFTLPILLDLAQRAQNNRLPIRRVVFIWMIKSTDWAVWIVNELQKAIRDLHEVGIEVETKIYVTCDPTFTESGEDTRRCGCDCDVRLGPCCCERTGEDDITPVPEKTTAIITSEKATSSPALSVLGSTTTPTTRKESNPVAARLLKFATLQSGRPNFKSLLWDLLDKSQGETGVAVCGPPGLSITVRNTVAAVSDQRGAAKGTGADGVYLHSECYYW
jgi:ferric-chelate reductase